MLTRRSGRLPVYATLEQALAVQPCHRLLTLRDALLPVSGAPRRTRDLATAACLRWDLPHLVAPACLIASELVVIGSEHAETMLDLKFTPGQRYLVIAVRDGNPTVPQLRPLTPQHIDGASIPAEGGKVVWAVLRTRPPSTC